MMAQLGAGELRCGDQVESWPFLGSLQSARLWVVFLGCLSASPEKERLAPRRAGVCGVAAPGGWAGRSRGLGRRALFPWPRPPVSVYFLPLSLRLTSPCGLWSLLSSAKVEEDRPLLVPASVEETHSSISQVFQRTWKAGTLTSPACLPWTLSFSFHCFAWSYIFLHSLFISPNWVDIMYVLLFPLISLPVWIYTFLFFLLSLKCGFQEWR